MEYMKKNIVAILDGKLLKENETNNDLIIHKQDKEYYLSYMFGGDLYRGSLKDVFDWLLIYYI